MATTILINNANIMSVTKKDELIMQRSKNAHPIRFYVERFYNNYDMNDATFSLEIVTPDGQYKTVILDKNENVVKDGYVIYDLNLPSELTVFAGSLKFQGTFVYVNSDLTNTDYQIIKCFECSMLGEEIPYDINELHNSRQAIRDKINELEKIIKN